MLQSRNLDDQSFDAIVEHAVSRLPQLCPQWTNYNPSDPGITLIELLAWYKEMQQYHMNVYTDRMKRKLLKLAGERVRPAAAAECYVRCLSSGTAYPEGTRLETPEGIVFELKEPIPARPAEITGVYLGRADEWEEITPILQKGRAGVDAFFYGGEKSELVIGLDTFGAERITLWFEVKEPDEPARNPFDTVEQRPREILWMLEGVGETEPVSDETHALSQSGLVTLAVPQQWAKTPVPGGRKAHCLRLSLRDPGCEENVILCAVSGAKYRAMQQETWSRLRAMTVSAKSDCTLRFEDAAAREGAFTLFLREADGWRQCNVEEVLPGEVTGVRLNAVSAAEDGSENLLAVCSDPVHYPDLFFDSDGLPGQVLKLDLGGRKLCTDRLTLICDTLCRDGGIRPQLWHCVEDLYACGPRERVFTYDAAREEITFGNGENGAVVPRGKAAIFFAEMVLTEGSGGNIPAGQRLIFESGCAVENDPATGGCDEESTAEAAARLLARLQAQHPCVTAEDYEELACAAPGLRVEQAKALPGWDPQEPTGQSCRPVVTMVVMPASAGAKPLPDERFLRQVRKHMETLRPVGTLLRVVSPRYAGVSLSVRLQTAGPVPEKEIRRVAEECLRVRRNGRNIGDMISAAELAAGFQKLPGVLAVRRGELSSSAPGCTLTVTGDLKLPGDCAAFLQSCNVLTY